MQRLAVVLLGALALAGCRGAQGEAESKASAEPSAAASAPADKGKDGEHAPGNSHAGANPEENGNFPVPFAWETSRDEPLAMARQFLRDLLNDNRAYMGRGAPFFAAFKDAQTPRATVITCSDSRVQTPAFDATPENDAFMIRNIGNQIANSEGSVEYGVEHLGTSVLLVLGHTGCGAVKAAMGDTAGLSPAVRGEVDKLKLQKPKAGGNPDAAWTEAVIENVNNQVAFALTRFGGRVQAAKLTVIGAVYDFRNDLVQGPGKVTIVNVNGNAEAQRMRAFVDAVEVQPPAKAGSKAAVNRNVEAASVRIEQALLETLKEAARLEPSSGGKRPEAARVGVTSAPKPPESTRIQVTPVPR
jgi:carbonic anhydrase